MGLRPEVQGRYTVPAGGGLDFDWDEANSRHIARHEVTHAGEPRASGDGLPGREAPGRGAF
jgi:hypothetical protein